MGRGGGLPALVGISEALTGCTPVRLSTAEAPAWLIWMAIQAPCLCTTSHSLNSLGR